MYVCMYVCMNEIYTSYECVRVYIHVCTVHNCHTIVQGQLIWHLGDGLIHCYICVIYIYVCVCMYV